MNQVPQELVQVVVPGAKKPWGILLLKLARVESSEDEGLGKEDASKQERIADIDADAGINLVSTHFDADTDMFGVNDLEGDEVVIKSEVNAKDVNLGVDEVTLAQALAALKSAKVHEKTNVVEEPSESITTTPTLAVDKGKEIMVEEPVVEKVKPVNRLEKIRLDEELAFKLQAEEEKEERLAREKAQQVKESNIVWDDVQSKIKADYQLA
ncbi:hypothetical protein Tco_0035509 [Tanacetum coccineum]